MTRIYLTAILFTLLSSNFAQAETIAIFDSGVDVKHEKLQHKQWFNKRERNNDRDDDRNGLIDDISGWNFIENSPQTFNYALYHSFHADVYKYYRIRAKKSLEQASPSELTWYNRQRKSPEFKKKREGFTSYIHGTHVTGVAIDTAHMPKEIKGLEQNIQFIPIKYLGKAKTGSFKAPEFSPLASGTNEQKLRHLQLFLKNYIIWQIKKLKTTIDYTKKYSRIINGSFGKSHKKTKENIATYYKKQFSSKISESLALKLTNKFLGDLILETKRLLAKYPNTLFLFSAGNSKADNDKLLHYPSNARTKNILAVGASDHNNKKAYFSNFGRRTVDLFAPGLAIRSSIPENKYIQVNGTSQAAPFVANVAAKSFELAKRIGVRLNAIHLREILVKTVHKTDHFKPLCTSGGMINPKRVYQAVRLLKTHPISRAIYLANQLKTEQIAQASKTPKVPLLLEVPEAF